MVPGASTEFTTRAGGATTGNARTPPMRSFQLAAFGAPLVATEGPVPAPEGRQVLLRTLACGVCHSDVHLADGFFDLGNGNRIDLARSLRLPRTLGHEIVGQVAALGPEAAGVA